MARPLAVAITGGIGAGKSAALEAFARRGIPTLSSDEIVHRLLRADDEVRTGVTERFGPGVADDRSKLGSLVFGDPEALAWLEALLHPRVVREYVSWREELGRGADPPRVVVVEVPLLYETCGEARFDRVVAITAPRDVRARRAKVSLDGREERLLSDDEKVRRADFAYVNDGSLDALDEFVGSVVARLGVAA
ncbi:MAG TPA: dephospho-CoA kinase [Gaiellaceae bacterium]